MKMTKVKIHQKKMIVNLQRFQQTKLGKQEDRDKENIILLMRSDSDFDDVRYFDKKLKINKCDGKSKI